MCKKNLSYAIVFLVLFFCSFFFIPLDQFVTACTFDKTAHKNLFSPKVDFYKPQALSLSMICMQIQICSVQ